MPFNNAAAWITSPNAHPFEVKSAPTGVPSSGQVLIYSRAIGINPVDYKRQHTNLHKGDIPYPSIFGEDVAGDVVAVGPGVTKFKIGDRITGLAAGFLTKKLEEEAFQKYVVLWESLSLKIPEKYSYEQACVFPLAASTAAAGLFNPEHLNLQLPTLLAQKPTGKAVLVWGGASAVGMAGIQLAVAAGYEVLTTASPKNFNLVKKLGASYVFDYKSPSIINDLLQAMEGKNSSGILDAIGGNMSAPIQDFAHRVDGVKQIASTVPGWPEPPSGVTIKHIFSLSITFSYVYKAIWDDYLPSAVEAGAFIPSPQPLVFGNGLESLQGAVDYLGKNGVSAQKVVISLD
ncbi:GroES-like protein [Fusarium austroafricanum]|uniref:GroES-like protein n=1 Tax=Fusarium austroafricanum TaxID=2364996 RepID=A0A8H4NUU9_9HYPO|nr:GroES-like protein [Fusarium austroafricanum]